MFDVKPVDETGVLDWKKINALKYSHSQVSNEDGMAVEMKSKAYILGVPIDSEAAPIFHDPHFSIEEYEKKVSRYDHHQRDEEIKKIEAQIAKEAMLRKLELEKIAEERRVRAQMLKKEIEEEKQRREQERILYLEIQKRELLKQKEILEKLQQENRSKEMQIALEKEKMQAEKEETIRREAIEKKLQLQKIAEFNRKQQIDYEKSVIEERERKQLEYENKIKENERIKKKEERKKELKKIWWFSEENKRKRKKPSAGGISIETIFTPAEMAFGFDFKSNVAAFTLVAVFVSFSLGGISYASKGFVLKDKVLGVSQDGYDNLKSAISQMAGQDFEGSSDKFSKAVDDFSQGSKQMEEMGAALVSASRFLPFASKLSSGKNALEAGKHFSQAGKALNEVVKQSALLKERGSKEISLLTFLNSAQENISFANSELVKAKENLELIAMDDLPQDKQEKFLLLKQNLPDIISALDFFLDNNHILVDLLGGNGPRKYLFLFQNNTEMRATGGFIGSYGLLDISNGHVRNFFIDGIFNPDGQLKERIVPPTAIQKISANWSLHDSNWFADFPQSAKKAIYFYEKTGGPTADGVITLTPTVLQKLLKITGPIEMAEYGVTLDSENFIELTQYEVEVDYDKQENKPKKILSDLAPLVMERLLSNKDLDNLTKTAQALLEGLEEKHILIYSQNSELQKIISKQRWSGEVLHAPKDYLSVINTNINGYKTDAVIEEKIYHKAQVQDDGSIINTVTVSRKHKGGSSQYDWFNKVNADYMRVYVPQGSKLLEANGHTRETVSEPVDYKSLGFRHDEDVEKEESSIVIDEKSGTRVYDQNDKTVFANWVYVSPGETATVEYKYMLPFRLFNVSFGEGQQVDSYSLVVQKQSGSTGSQFEFILHYPNDYGLNWNFPADMDLSGEKLKFEKKLETDHFLGVVFTKDN